MRNKKIDKERFRKPADILLRRMCEADGMSSIRAWWVYNGLRFAGIGALTLGIFQVFFMPRGTKEHKKIGWWLKQHLTNHFSGLLTHPLNSNVIHL